MKSRCWKIQSLMGVPGMGEKVAADEHGLGLFPEDGLKKLLVSGYPAVEVGDKNVTAHRNDSENAEERGEQLRRIQT